MEYKDYYKVLGLERTATPEEIKRAYRKLARAHHPDVNADPGAVDRFKEIGEAYDALKDPEKRAAYDRLGSGWEAGEGFKPPPDWDGGFQFADGDFAGGDGADHTDFFETLFGAGGRRGFHGAAPSRLARIEIDLADAYTGANRKFTLRTPKIDASGRASLDERTLEVAIPKGVTAGEHLRVGGGQSGLEDLILEIAFRAHPVYRTDGRDVALDLPITPWEAALGGEIRMPTPGGEVKLKIPKNARSGQKLRLRGKGIPGAPPGNLFAILSIVTPPVVNAEGRAFYERMAKEMSFDPRAKMEFRT